MTLSTPAQVQGALETIGGEIATKQNEYEDAAWKWFRLKPERAKLWAEVYVKTDGPGHIRKAAADGSVGENLAWSEAECAYELLKVKLRTLSDRANIGMAILKAQGRA